MTAEEIKSATDELTALFATIQKIEAPMTENNVVVMNACLGSIKFVHDLLAKGGSDNGNIDAE